MEVLYLLVKNSFQKLRSAPLKFVWELPINAEDEKHKRCRRAHDTHIEPLHLWRATQCRWQPHMSPLVQKLRRKQFAICVLQIFISFSSHLWKSKSTIFCRPYLSLCTQVFIHYRLGLYLKKKKKRKKKRKMCNYCFVYLYWPWKLSVLAENNPWCVSIEVKVKAVRTTESCPSRCGAEMSLCWQLEKTTTKESNLGSFGIDR